MIAKTKAQRLTKKAFALNSFSLGLLLESLLFFNMVQLGTVGNVEASLSSSFVFVLAAIKMVEVLRSEVSRSAHNLRKKGPIVSGPSRDVFNLSDGEEKFIVNVKIGQGLEVDAGRRIPFYNFLSDEERRLFTTQPKEFYLLDSPKRLRYGTLSELGLKD